MYEVLFRLKFIKSNRVIECVFDERLSFNDNFRLLKELTKINDDFEIYDPDKKIFLKKEIPIREFGISRFMLLYVFE